MINSKVKLYIPLLFITLVICLICFACNEKKNKDSVLYLTPKQNIKTCIDSFIRVNGKNGLYHEIYIHGFDIYSKKTDDYSVLIYSGSKSLSENEPPITFTKVKGVIFNIYSGANHYFRNENQQTRKDHYTKIPVNKNTDGNYWVCSFHDKAREAVGDKYIQFKDTLNIRVSKPIFPYTDELIRQAHVILFK